MRVHRYVIRNDDGSAPNYDPPAATLAICKPRIRRGASPGDVVLAFAGKTLGPEPHAVRWAGVVSEKLTFADYWRDPRFAVKKPRNTPRSDNIYRPIGDVLRQVRNKVHAEGNAATDLGGEFVLVFKEVWRFGSAAPVLPEEFGLRMTGGRRGHRVTQIDDTNWKALRQWLRAQRVRRESDDGASDGCPPKNVRHC